VSALGVTDGLLPILGVAPLLGRSFTQADDSPGSNDTVILTYSYWLQKFGGDHSAIGRTIDVDGKPRTIIGVLPQSFRFLDSPRVAMLLPMKLNRAETYLDSFFYGGIVRLKPGVTVEQANTDASRMLPIVGRSFSPPPGFSRKAFENARLAPNLRPLAQDMVRDVGKVLWVLMAGISLVLVIACANLANLLLVRAEGRHQELATRAALGASRRRIAAELFLESLILVFLGGLLGLGLAYGAVRGLIAVAPAGLPRLGEIGIDGNVVLFTLAVSLSTSLLVGSFPGFKYARAGLGLREGGHSMSESRERHRLRGVLVIVQVALALVLLVSSGLMIRTLRALTRVNPGFVTPSEVQTFGVQIRDTQVKESESVVRILAEISHHIEAISSVSSVGISRNIPMDASRWNGPVYAQDRTTDSSNQIPSRRFEFVAPGYFKTLGTPLVAGRDFTWTDIYNKVPVAIVSEKLARENWREPSSALGKQIREGPRGDWREVVGVVANIHQDGPDKEAPTSVYWPILAVHFMGGEVRRNVAFAIRSPRAGSEGLMKEVQQAVWSVDPSLPLADVHTLDYYYTRAMARTSFTFVMLAVAAGMALLLGIVGLYGVIAYSVSQRRRVIGILMALGAGKREVLKMVISQGIRLTLIGVIIGLAGALYVTRFLSSLLYGVKPGDPPTLVAVSTLLIIVSLLASYIPARQAAKVDPTVALRHE
jgi:predicted permease